MALSHLIDQHHLILLNIGNHVFSTRCFKDIVCKLNNYKDLDVQGAVGGTLPHAFDVYITMYFFFDDILLNRGPSIVSQGNKIIGLRHCNNLYSSCQKED